MNFQAAIATSLENDTPFFLADKSALNAAIDRVAAAAAAWDGPFEIAYSLKTNPLPELLRTVSQRGCWVEVVSSWEFEQALDAGFEPERIVFNGPLKAKGVPSHNLGAQVINIDSVCEAERLASLSDIKNAVRVGLRVCPDQAAPSWSRFGLHVGAGEFDEALSIVRSAPHLQLVGLHGHLGTQIRGARPYAQLAEYLAPLWKQAALGAEGILDIGGGFWFDHAGDSYEDSVSDAVEAVAAAWPYHPRPTLVVEPGRIIAAPYLTLISKVIAVKKRPDEPDVVVLDSGTNHNVSAAFFQHDIQFFPPPEYPSSVRVVGPLCMEDDIMSGELELGVPRQGSLCVMRNAGAYSVAFQRRFIQELPQVLDLDGREKSSGSAKP